MQTCMLKVNIHCEGCKHKVKKILQKIEGVYAAEVDAETGRVMVTGNVDPATVIKKLGKAGKHAVLWGAPKGGGGRGFNLNNQFQKLNLSDLKIKPGGGKDQKGVFRQPALPQKQQQHHQLVQQKKGIKDLKLIPRLKDLKFLPFQKGGQKSGKLSFPRGDGSDYDDDDEDYDDDLDDDDEDFADLDGLGYDFKEELRSKMKPGAMSFAPQGKKKGSGGFGGGAINGGIAAKFKGGNGGSANDGKNGKGGGGKKGGNFNNGGNSGGNFNPFSSNGAAKKKGGAKNNNGGGAGSHHMGHHGGFPAAMDHMGQIGGGIHPSMANGVGNGGGGPYSAMPQGYFQGGMAAVPPHLMGSANSTGANPYLQQQQHMAAMFQQQQQQQQQQQRMMMNGGGGGGGGGYDRMYPYMPPRPMGYPRPPPQMMPGGYMPAPLPAMHASTGEAYHMFDDENTNSCSIM